MRAACYVCLPLRLFLRVRQQVQLHVRTWHVARTDRSLHWSINRTELNKDTNKKTNKHHPGPKSQGTKGNFGHFQLLKQYADRSDKIKKYKFLLALQNIIIIIIIIIFSETIAELYANVGAPEKPIKYKKRKLTSFTIERF